MNQDELQAVANEKPAYLHESAFAIQRDSYHATTSALLALCGRERGEGIK